jgi:hypothetical protein
VQKVALPVYGMRNWRPFVWHALKQAGGGRDSSCGGDLPGLHREPASVCTAPLARQLILAMFDFGPGTMRR